MSVKNQKLDEQIENKKLISYQNEIKDNKILNQVFDKHEAKYKRLKFKPDRSLIKTIKDQHIMTSKDRPVYARMKSKWYITQEMKQEIRQNKYKFIVQLNEEEIQRRVKSGGWRQII